MRRPKALVSLGALGTLAAIAFARPARAVEPHLSEQYLPSSNGFVSIAYDSKGLRLTQFLEHPYAYPSSTGTTRNFLYDSYPGIRIGTTATWLTAVTPTTTEYLPGTGIVHVVRSYQGLTLDEYDFAPMGLTEYASLMLLKVTRTSGAGAIDAFSLFNYHLGSGSPLPGTDSEQINYDASRDAFYEWGPSGVAFAYSSIAPSTHHGATPDNPYDSVNANANLADDTGTSGPTTDAAAGFQQSLSNLPVGGSAWAGWFAVLAPDADGQAANDRVRTWIASRTSDKILADEVSAWNAWVKPLPMASTTEAAVAQQAQVVLRMGQVSEPGASAGQILASIAPGEWNITWVRDMAYSTVALAKSGHFAEAKAALAFQMGATVGGYQSYVGAPYQISVVRYYGNGTEQSDSNQDGPNIEFDGFGLFLWALDEYVEASGDTAALTTWWPIVSTKVANVLVELQESTGLIAPDSSIWEVHWNGNQRHFGYTTATAANGLCAAGRLAGKMNDAANAAKYTAAGGKARDAILSQLRAPDGTIGQSVEALASGTGWLDASELEAINFGLVDPSRGTAQATLDAIETGLVPPSGRGFMRDDLGAWYDSQEWVFIDLRAARSLELHGDATSSASLFAWNVDQASDNFGEFSELHDATTADYAGASPMVGFGAGAYLIALADRGSPGTPTCGAYAVEPANPIDAGPDAQPGTEPDAGSDAEPDGATPSSGADAGIDPADLQDASLGANAEAPKANSGCACTLRDGHDDPLGALASLGALGAVLALFRRQKRRTSSS